MCMPSTISEEEYQKLREWTMKDLEKYTNHRPDKLTCDDCPARFNCEFAADGYNTGGDCLAEK